MNASVPPLPAQQLLAYLDDSLRAKQQQRKPMSARAVGVQLDRASLTNRLDRIDVNARTIV